MARLKILTFPNPILAQKAKPLVRVDASLYPLADDMLETMYSAPGVGLAANQVGILDRMLVLDIDYSLKDSDDEMDPLIAPEESPENITESLDGEVVPSERVINKQPQIYINPEIIYKEGAQCFQEGCLSVPGFQHEVTRALRIKVRYQTIDGITKVLDAEDFLAVVIQHEMDHLDGKLFIDRLNPLEQPLIKKMLRKRKK
jgi:peptide deformylase